MTFNPSKRCVSFNPLMFFYSLTVWELFLNMSLEGRQNSIRFVEYELFVSRRLQTTLTEA